MSTDLQQLDVRYISTLITWLVKAEISYSSHTDSCGTDYMYLLVHIPEGVVGQIDGKADLFDDWATSYSMMPCIWTHCVKRTQKLLLCGVLKTVRHPTPTNSIVYFVRLVLPLKDSRVVTCYQHQWHLSLWPIPGDDVGRYRHWRKWPVVSASIPYSGRQKQWQLRLVHDLYSSEGDVTAWLIRDFRPTLGYNFGYEWWLLGPPGGGGGVGRAHHRFYMRHLANNFHSWFRDKSLNTLLVWLHTNVSPQTTRWSDWPR